MSNPARLRRTRKHVRTTRIVETDNTTPTAYGGKDEKNYSWLVGALIIIFILGCYAVYYFKHQ